MNNTLKGKKESKLSRLFDSKTKIRIAQLALLTIVLAAATLGGTYAYLMANTEPAVNDFTFGIPKVTVVEPLIDPASVQWGATSKPVYLSIPSGAIGGAVRAAIIPMFKDTEGNIIAASSVPITEPTTSNTVVMGDITLHFIDEWETHWLYKDGFFYYRKALNTEQKTTQLLAGVTLTSNTPEMTAKYQNIVVEIEVMADVLQADQAALTNWGITIDGDGNIT